MENLQLSKIYCRLADDFQRQGILDKAVSYYIKSIEAEPTFSLPYYKLKYVDEIQPNQLSEIIALYKHLIKSQPSFILTYLSLGDMLTRQGMLDDAIQLYQVAVNKQIKISKPNIFRQSKSNEPSKPNFLIVGFMKCGTTSLYEYLSQHSQIIPCIKKEVHFFDWEYDRGYKWYLAHFPPVVENELFLTGEATPYYLLSSKAKNRIITHLPNVKLIVILRNPSDRAISHYYHQVNWGLENRSFKEALITELKILQQFNHCLTFESLVNTNIDLPKYGYLTCSLYTYFLEKWMTSIPKKQFLVLKSEELYTNPTATMKQVFEFLELTNQELPQYMKYVSGAYPTTSAKIKKILSDFLKPHTKRLESYLNMQFNWE